MDCNKIYTITWLSSCKKPKPSSMSFTRPKMDANLVASEKINYNFKYAMQSFLKCTSMRKISLANCTIKEDFKE